MLCRIKKLKEILQLHFTIQAELSWGAPLATIMDKFVQPVFSPCWWWTVEHEEAIHLCFIKHHRFCSELTTLSRELNNFQTLDLQRPRPSHNQPFSDEGHGTVERGLTIWFLTLNYSYNASGGQRSWERIWCGVEKDASHKLLECLSVPSQIVRCILHLISLWTTRFTVTFGKTRVFTGAVLFRKGIYHGDTLSLLLFCISLLPFFVTLRQTHEYKAGRVSNRIHKVTHFFYMNDLKVYAVSPERLRTALEVVSEYISTIGIKFGLDKCAVAHLVKGRSPN